jgi:rhodanese-related sulfurtransferase
MSDITAEELKQRIDQGEKLNIVDVREEYESEEFSIGGTLIPLGTLPDHVNELEPLKNEEVIVYCRSGNRSGQAKMFLESVGFTNVRNLTGGTNRWLQVNPG